MIAYRGRNEDIAKATRAILGDNVPVEVIEYSPVVPLLASREKFRLGLMTGMDMAHEQGESNDKTPRGKLLLQYRPATCSRAEAGWRLWVEDRTDLARRFDTWTATDGQRFSKPANDKRDEGAACSILSTASSAASVMTTLDSSGHTIVIGPTGTSTIHNPAETTLGQCKVERGDKDCSGQNMSCTGGTVARCEDGRCKCKKPALAPGSACNVAKDCHPVSSCNTTTQMDECENKRCVCKAAPVTSTKATVTSSAAPVTSIVPEPTQTKSVPKPSPTSAIAIGYWQVEVGSRGFTEIVSSWNFYTTPVGVNVDECTAESKMSHDADDYSIPKDVPWPPNLGMTIEVFGHKGCHYIENTKGPGRFACNDVDEFDCVEDGQNGQVSECSLPGDGWGSRFPVQAVPKVQCHLPA